MSTSGTSHDGHGTHPSRGDIVREGKQLLSRAKEEARQELKHSTTGAAIAGGAVVAAAMLIGLPETILGAAAGLVVYRILESRRSNGTQ